MCSSSLVPSSILDIKSFFRFFNSCISRLIFWFSMLILLFFSFKFWSVTKSGSTNLLTSINLDNAYIDKLNGIIAIPGVPILKKDVTKIVHITHCFFKISFFIYLFSLIWIYVYLNTLDGLIALEFWRSDNKWYIFF